MGDARPLDQQQPVSEMEMPDWLRDDVIVEEEKSLEEESDVAEFKAKLSSLITTYRSVIYRAESNPLQDFDKQEIRMTRLRTLVDVYESMLDFAEKSKISESDLGHLKSLMTTAHKRLSEKTLKALRA